MRIFFIIILVLFSNHSFSQSTEITSSEIANSLVSEIYADFERLKKDLEKYKNESDGKFDSLHNETNAQREQIIQLVNEIDDKVRRSNIDLTTSLENLKRENQILYQMHEAHANETNIKLDALRNEISLELDNANEKVRLVSEKSDEESAVITSAIDSLRTELQSLKINLENSENGLDIKLIGLNDALATNTKKLDEIGINFKSRLQKVEDTTATTFSDLHDSIDQYWRYWAVSTALLALFLVVQFLMLRKYSMNYAELVGSNADDAGSKQEKYAQNDDKILKLIDAQLSIINSERVSQPKEENHTLALKVADEIVRIQKNLSRMDEKTKGLKQLSASVTRIQDNFASNGYEIVEMLGTSYNEGMKVSANFIPDDNLEVGQRIITRIIKPQVNYNGVMIQSAQIEVSQGE